jgi:hypothetical protein
MRVVHEAVEDRVGISRIADHLMPRRDRQLAGDDRRAAAIAFLQDFEEVMVRLGIEWFEPPVVEDQELDAAKLGLERFPHELSRGGFPFDA